MRRSALPSAAISLALAFVALPARAGSFWIADKGIQIDVYTWEGRPCQVKPDTTDQSGCLPGDHAVALPLIDHGEVVTFAIVHYDGWDMRVVATRLDVDQGALERIDPEDLVAVANAALPITTLPPARLVASGADQSVPVRRSNGVRFVRLTPAVETSLPSGARGNAATVEYVAVSGASAYQIAFTADANHAADVDKVADNAFGTLVATPDRKAAGIPYAVKRLLTRVIELALVGLLLLAFAKWRGARSARKTTV